jgi:hypothetical protein
MLGQPKALFMRHGPKLLRSVFAGIHGRVRSQTVGATPTGKVNVGVLGGMFDTHAD